MVTNERHFETHQLTHNSRFCVSRALTKKSDHSSERAKLVEGALEEVRIGLPNGGQFANDEEFNFLVATTKTVLRAQSDFGLSSASALSEVRCRSGLVDCFGGNRGTSVVPNNSSAGTPTSHIHVTTLIPGTQRGESFLLTGIVDGYGGLVIPLSSVLVHFAHSSAAAINRCLRLGADEDHRFQVCLREVFGCMRDDCLAAFFCSLCDEDFRTARYLNAVCKLRAPMTSTRRGGCFCGTLSFDCVQLQCKASMPPCLGTTDSQKIQSSHRSSTIPKSHPREKGTASFSLASLKNIRFQGSNQSEGFCVV